MKYWILAAIPWIAVIAICAWVLISAANFEAACTSQDGHLYRNLCLSADNRLVELP